MAKKARVWTGTEFVELASAQTDLTAYSTTAQMNTAITAGVGLVPILTQTIGTAVSSVTVSNAFSATYDAYKIIITGSGVHSGGSNITLKLGASTTGYYYSGFLMSYSTGSTSALYGSNQANFLYAGYGTTATRIFDVDLINPGTANYTIYESKYTAIADATYQQGIHQVATAYTDFTITAGSGTMTGGTIRVYGYKN